MNPQCEGCEHDRHYGHACHCGCRYGALLRLATRDDPVLVRFARYYATIQHAGQLYGGTLPYTHHLDQVDRNVQEYWEPSRYRLVEPGETWDHVLSVIRASAWLHDVSEDCAVSAKTLHELFGEDVARLVLCVTDEAGVNRAARQMLTYPKIRAFPRAVYLKLCDRLANLQAGGAMLEMYRKEHATFKGQLWSACEFDELWQHVDFLIGHRP